MPRHTPAVAAQAFYWPAESAVSPAPAVVILHGAAGLSLGREGRYAEMLSARGISAVIVDSFNSREGGRASLTDRLLNVTETMVVADAYSARAWLAKRPEVDVKRIALLGFSYGGMASILASHEQVRQAFEPNGGGFAAHVSFYGPCVVRFERIATTHAPIAVMLGADDANVPVDRCREIVADLEHGGSKVELSIYAGATHQWDSPWARERTRMSMNLSACRFRVEADGSVTNLNTGMEMSGWLSRRITLAACVDSSGYFIMRNEEVMQRADTDLLRFLDSALR